MGILKLHYTYFTGQNFLKKPHTQCQNGRREGVTIRALGYRASSGLKSVLWRWSGEIQRKYLAAITQGLACSLLCSFYTAFRQQLKQQCKRLDDFLNILEFISNSTYRKAQMLEKSKRRFLPLRRRSWYVVAFNDSKHKR